MTIRKAFEITCDGCGSSEPCYGGNRMDIEYMWKSHGWVFVGDMHFCSKECASRKQTTVKDANNGS